MCLVVKIFLRLLYLPSANIAFHTNFMSKKTVSFRYFVSVTAVSHEQKEHRPTRDSNPEP